MLVITRQWAVVAAIEGDIEGEGSIEGVSGGGGGREEASFHPNLQAPPRNVACCVQCLYSTTTVIR